MTLADPKPEQVPEIRWSPAGSAPTPASSSLRELIGITGSLTRQLRQRCNGAFRLDLLGERRRAESQALVREVLMCCGDTPWVFAQTVIPETTLSANGWLAELGERPLGDTLFDRPNVSRSGLYVAQLVPGQRLYERALGDALTGERPDELWARRSVIRIVDAELSINEVFFPAAGRCPKD